MLKLIFSVLNPNHYSQNIGLLKYCILWKYAWKKLNGCLLQWCYFFVHMIMLRYFVGLSVFCFRKTNPNIQRFRTFFHSALASTMMKSSWISLRFSVDKCRQTSKVCSTCKVVCFLIRLLFLYFNEIANY